MFAKEYVAGFFDGEGSVGIYYLNNGKKSKIYRLEVQISQTENKETIKLLEFLKKTYGGNIIRCIKYGNQMSWMRYKLTSLKALNFLKDIYPNIVLKKTQLEIAFKFYDKSISKEEAEKSMKLAKRIGIKTPSEPLVPSGEVEKKRIQGWCQLHFEKGVEYPLLKISYEDENGNETISEKLACPKCVKSLEGKGVGRVYYL